MSDETTRHDTVTPERLEHYLKLTARARASATATPPADSHGARTLADLLRMADDYASDARRFRDTGDLVHAFGAINYAHAWIDAAVRLGLLDAHGDDELFTLP